MVVCEWGFVCCRAAGRQRIAILLMGAAAVFRTKIVFSPIFIDVFKWTL